MNVYNPKFVSTLGKALLKLIIYNSSAELIAAEELYSLDYQYVYFANNSAWKMLKMWLLEGVICNLHRLTKDSVVF